MQSRSPQQFASGSTQMNKKIELESPLKRVHLPIESANGLPNECYTERSAFDRDREYQQTGLYRLN